MHTYEDTRICAENRAQGRVKGMEAGDVCECVSVRNENTKHRPCVEKELNLLNSGKTQTYRTDCILEMTSRENRSIQNRIKLNIVKYSTTNT